LKLLTINGSGSVIDRIKECLIIVEVEKEVDDSTLTFFISCCEKWMKIYCREHVNILDGNVRFHLQSFFDETILVNSGYNLNLNMRDNEDVITKEMEYILRLSWKLHKEGQCNNKLWSSMNYIKDEIQKVEKFYHGVVTDAALEEMIVNLLIQKYLHAILTEQTNNAYSLHFGHHIVMLRLFKLKKSSTTDCNDTTPMLRSCGEFGSILSLHIHIYRLAAASLIACTESECWQGILDQVKNSSLCNILSPLINKVKQMNNSKITVRKKQLKANEIV
jgi:hypothetical protein